MVGTKWTGSLGGFAQFGVAAGIGWGPDAGIASLFVFYSFWAIFLFFEGGFGKVAPHDGELHLENAN